MTELVLDVEKLKETIQRNFDFLHGYILGHSAGPESILPFFKLQEIYRAALNWVETVKKDKAP